MFSIEYHSFWLWRETPIKQIETILLAIVIFYNDVVLNFEVRKDNKYLGPFFVIIRLVRIAIL